MTFSENIDSLAETGEPAGEPAGLPAGVPGHGYVDHRSTMPNPGNANTSNGMDMK